MRLAFLNTAVVTVAVSNNGMALQHAGGSAKKDRGVLLAATRQNGLALRFVDLGALSTALQLEVAVTAAQGLLSRTWLTLDQFVQEWDTLFVIQLFLHT